MSAACVHLESALSSARSIFKCVGYSSLCGAGTGVGAGQHCDVRVVHWRILGRARSGGAARYQRRRPRRNV